MRLPSGEKDGEVSIAGVSVSRVVDFERRSITNRFELPPCCRLMMMRWPSGENRGENDMPGKLPTISRWPVSVLSRYTRGSPCPNSMYVISWVDGENRGVSTRSAPLVRYLT